MKYLLTLLMLIPALSFSQRDTRIAHEYKFVTASDSTETAGVFIWEFSDSVIRISGRNSLGELKSKSYIVTAKPFVGNESDELIVINYPNSRTPLCSVVYDKVYDIVGAVSFGDPTVLENIHFATRTLSIIK